MDPVRDSKAIGLGVEAPIGLGANSLRAKQARNMSLIIRLGHHKLLRVIAAS